MKVEKTAQNGDLQETAWGIFIQYIFVLNDYLDYKTNEEIWESTVYFLLVIKC